MHQVRLMLSCQYWSKHKMSYIGNVVNVINANLSEDLDVSGQDIVSSSNGNIEILPHGSGKVHIDGNGTSGGVLVSDGLIEIKTGTGSVGELRFYCETSNLHYTSLKSAAHGTYSGNVVLTLPSSDGNSGEYLKTDGSGVLSWDTPSAGGNAFTTIAVSGQSDVVADSSSDTLTLVAGSNITITTNASGDSITIASSGGGGGSLSGNLAGDIASNTHTINIADGTGGTSNGYSPDGDVINLGASNDMQIFHNSREGSGFNIIKCNNQMDLKIVDDGYTQMALFERWGKVLLTNDGRTSIQTARDTNNYGTVTIGGGTGSTPYTLPGSIGSSGEVLKVPSSGSELEWGSAGGGGGGSFTGGEVANDIILGSTSNTSNHSNAVDIETVAQNDTIMGVGRGSARSGGTFREAWMYSSSNAASENKYNEKIAIAFRDASGGAGGGADQAGFNFYSSSIQTMMRQAGYNFELLGCSSGVSTHNTARVSIYNASGSGGSSSVGAGSMIEFGLNHPDAKYKFTDCWSYGNTYNYTFPRTAPSGTGQVLVSDSNGDCTWQANSSDIRVKKKIEDNEMGLEFIEALRTVNFEFKSYNELHSTQPELTQYQPHSYEDLDEPPEEHKKGVQTGLVAQELEEVLTSQGCEHFKGLFDDRFNVKQIDKEEFIMPLIKAVQELSQKVRDLEERLAE